MVLPDVMKQGLVDADAKGRRWKLWDLVAITQASLVGVDLSPGN